MRVSNKQGSCRLRVSFGGRRGGRGEHLWLPEIERERGGKMGREHCFISGQTWSLFYLPSRFFFFSSPHWFNKTRQWGWNPFPKMASRNEWRKKRNVEQARNTQGSCSGSALNGTFVNRQTRTRRSDLGLPWQPLSPPYHAVLSASTRRARILFLS